MENLRRFPRNNIRETETPAIVEYARHTDGMCHMRPATPGRAGREEPVLMPKPP